MNHKMISWLAQGTAMLATTLAMPATAAVNFKTIDYFDCDYYFYGFLSGVSADGSVVSGTKCDKNDSYKYLPFRWTEATGTKIFRNATHPDWYTPTGDAVSDDGQVVVGQDGSYISSVFRWTATPGGSGVLRRGEADANYFPSATSADGTTIVGYQWGIQIAPFLWNASTGWHRLAPLPHPYTMGAALGITPDASVVVGRVNIESQPDTYQAFRWTASGKYELLGDLSPTERLSSQALDVSADGEVVVGSGKVSEGTVAMRWTAASGMQSLGDLPGGEVYSVAHGIANDGRIIVGSSSTMASDGSTTNAAFVWTEELGMRNLKELIEVDFGYSLTGWRLASAIDISGDGSTIIGTAYDPNGNELGYVVRLTDFDHDGYEVPADCDDTRAGVNPVAPEMPQDGIDQNCNGDDST